MIISDVQKKEKNTVEITVTVEKEQFVQAVSAAYRKNAGKINVPGFRKGKAPRNVIEKMYGKSVFYEDAVNDTVYVAYEQAIGEKEISAVDQPSIELLEVNDDGYSFKATITVKPEFTLKKYSGFELEKLKTDAKDEEIESEVNSLRDRYARLKSVEDRPAAMGDTADIDFEGFKDGEAFDGGKGEGHKLKLGSGQFIPGFEEQIVGKNIGDEFDVNVSFPEDYHVEELAGKPVVFKVKLNALEETELPELDDEFAKDVSEFDTFAELKKSIAEKIEHQKKHSSDDTFVSDAIDLIAADTEIDIPDAMIKNELGLIKSDYEQNVSRMGVTLEQYLQYVGQTMEQFEDAMREPAAKNVKGRLILEKIAELEKLEVADSDIDAEYDRIAKAYKLDAEKVKSIVPVTGIKADVLVKKATEYVVNSNKAILVDEKTPKEVPEKKATKAAKSESEKDEKETEKAGCKTKTAAKTTAAKKKTATKTATEKDAE